MAWLITNFTWTMLTIEQPTLRPHSQKSYVTHYYTHTEWGGTHTCSPACVQHAYNETYTINTTVNTLHLVSKYNVQKLRPVLAWPLIVTPVHHPALLCEVHGHNLVHSHFLRCKVLMNSLWSCDANLRTKWTTCFFNFFKIILFS